MLKRSCGLNQSLLKDILEELTLIKETGLFDIVMQVSDADPGFHVGPVYMGAGDPR